MDFKKIEAFLTIASLGKYTTAAEKLYTSQSSLSKQMKQLETELGAPLFKKTGNGVELTRAGWEFYYYARRALPELQQTMAHIEQLKNSGKAPFRLGALPLIEDYGFADCFADFWHQTPSVQIDYFERSQGDLIGMLERNKIDLALARLDLLDQSKYNMRPVLRDEIVLVCHKHNPLAQLEQVSIAALRNEQFILPAARSDLAQIFLNACQEQGFRPNVPLHHSRHSMLVRAVSRGMGTCVLPRGMAQASYAKDVVCVPFDTPISTTIGFIWLPGAALNQITRELVGFVCAEYGNK